LADSALPAEAIQDHGCASTEHGRVSYTAEWPKRNTDLAELSWRHPSGQRLLPARVSLESGNAGAGSGAIAGPEPRDDGGGDSRLNHNLGNHDETIRG